MIITDYTSKFKKTIPIFPKKKALLNSTWYVIIEDEYVTSIENHTFILNTKDFVPHTKYQKFYSLSLKECSYLKLKLTTKPYIDILFTWEHL